MLNKFYQKKFKFRFGLFWHFDAVLIVCHKIYNRKIGGGCSLSLSFNVSCEFNLPLLL
jgi:hypothetical protein